MYFLILWATFGLARIVIHFRTKGKLKINTKDNVFVTMILPYMLSVIVAVFEFDFGSIEVNCGGAIIGLVFFIVGSAAQFAGLLTLKDRFSNAVELQGNHSVVNNGIYRIIRHPIYLGILLQGVSTLLLLNVKIAGVFVVWSMVGVIMRIRKEDQYLSENLPGYKDYKSRTKALIPKIY